MPIQVLMPILGESVEEATITRWLKAVGESVDEYEPLLEVNTDKVDTEIPSPASGVLLEIQVPEGAIVQAGSLLAWIGEAGETAAEADIVSLADIATESAAENNGATGVEMPVKREVPAAGRDRELGFISPIVARLASEHHLDLYQVSGTGKGGRITKNDVLAYIEQTRAISPELLTRELKPPASSPAMLQSRSVESVSPTLPGQVIPLTPVRRSIAEHMVHSKHTSPHVTTIMEADLSQVVTHREAQKAVFSQDGVKLTYTAYFIAATIAALKAYPLVNSAWSEDGILIHKDINIGMATSLGEEGLIVPVIINADRLSLLGLAGKINDLANRARAKQLQPEEVKGGTFTITNHGISGSLFATPIINQPQCGILGVGAIQKRVVVIGDAIAIRPMAYLSLTFDHRILDGAVADYFLGKVVESLQNWPI